MDVEEEEEVEESGASENGTDVDEEFHANESANGSDSTPKKVLRQGAMLKESDSSDFEDDDEEQEYVPTVFRKLITERIYEDDYVEIESNADENEG